ncbi:MAG: CDP-alcohol phosphatidyltransferase family protein [Clostridia bacterium]|nr:CDP-alcohol phosphatidyltransferase family protein [Clostridia bacterium]
MKSNIKELFAGCLTIPNLLSVIRIALIPVFGVLYYQGNILWAVIVLFISGLTDFFDGKIARKFNQISALGKVLDPVADKLTQITIAIVLYLTFSESANETIKAFSWVFLIFLIKEVLMVIGGGLMIAFGLRPSAAEMPGKIATFVFYAVMIIIIAFGPDIGLVKAFVLPDWFMIILVCISAVLTLVAFCSYLPDTFRQVKERKSGK